MRPQERVEERGRARVGQNEGGGGVVWWCTTQSLLFVADRVQVRGGKWPAAPLMLTGYSSAR
jgi:hypothetical protein